MWCYSSYSAKQSDKTIYKWIVITCCPCWIWLRIVKNFSSGLPISSHCKDNFSVVMHWTVEGSTAKHCFCQNFKGGSDWRKYIIWRWWCPVMRTEWRWWWSLLVILAGMHLHAGAYIVTSGKTVVIIPASQDQQLALHWNTGTASIFWWTFWSRVSMSWWL